MDYGNRSILDTRDALKNASSIGVNVPKPHDFAATTRALACDVRHPLTAILANANAAQRWLNRPDANLAEAMAALDRIARDIARIDAAIDGIRAMATEPADKASLP
jgi:signal transduction histidine kinase